MSEYITHGGMVMVFATVLWWVVRWMVGLIEKKFEKLDSNINLNALALEKKIADVIDSLKEKDIRQDGQILGIHERLNNQTTMMAVIQEKMGRFSADLSALTDQYDRRHRKSSQEC